MRPGDRLFRSSDREAFTDGWTVVVS